MGDAVRVMVVGLCQFSSGSADVSTPISVCGKVGLKGVVFLQQSLHRRHGVPVVLHGQQLLLLTVTFPPPPLIKRGQVPTFSGLFVTFCFLTGQTRKKFISGICVQEICQGYLIEVIKLLSPTALVACKLSNNYKYAEFRTILINCRG